MPFPDSPRFKWHDSQFQALFEVLQEVSAKPRGETAGLDRSIARMLIRELTQLQVDKERLEQQLAEARGYEQVDLTPRGNVHCPECQGDPISLGCSKCGAEPRAVVFDDEHRGLYRKYSVRRVSDPEGKHTGCEYFVLDWNHDKFAIPAMAAYATACEKDFPRLAQDIKDRITRYGGEAPEKEAPEVQVRLRSGTVNLMHRFVDLMAQHGSATTYTKDMTMRLALMELFKDLIHASNEQE